ncbi:MAG: hypothetical protein CMH27_06535 [Micavibrio sp.]|nr:hypothetical protein [Micavibrio sp.]
MRALEITSNFGTLTQQGAARKVKRQAKRVGLTGLRAGQRIHYAEHFLKNPVKSLLGRPEMKTMLVSNFRYAVDPTLGGIRSRACMTESVAVRGKTFSDDKVVASAVIDASGKYAKGQINSDGVGNQNYMQNTLSSVQHQYSGAVANSNQPATPAQSQHTSYDAPRAEMAA